MQTITADAKKVLTSKGAVVDFGCDQIDASGTVTDISGDLIGGSVSHSGYASVHRTCDLQLTRELDWPNIWLRPWQSVSAHGVTVAYPLGVFRPAWPELPMGSDPLIWRVTGADRISLLQDKLPDSMFYAAGSAVLDDVAAVIALADVPGKLLADSTAASTVLDRDLVWLLTSGDDAASFLRVTNDLADSVSYRAIYMDANGNYRLVRYQPPAERAATWTFDLTDAATNIVEVGRTSRTSTYSGYNHWTFTRANMPAKPSIGAGLYVVDKSDGDRKRRRYVTVTAADQASLVSQGDRIVIQDTTVTQTVDIQATGFPVLGHFDVVDYRDPQLGGALLHCQIPNWDIDLASGSCRMTLEVPRG